MKGPSSTRRSGYLFVASGGMFFVAALLGRQAAFWGPGVALVAIGAAYLAKARRAP